MKVSPAVQKLCHSSDEWFVSKGSLGIAVKRWKGTWRVTIFPSLREKVGGFQDGKKVYSPFFIVIEKLMAVFDQPPSIQYDSGRKKMPPPFIYLQGRINGELFTISIVPKPPPGTPVSEQCFDGDDERVSYKLKTIDQAMKG